MKTFLFHGPSGSGKDTQVEKLLENNQLERIATGEMFRKLYEEKDPEGIAAYKYWGNGVFNPDDQTYKLLKVWLKRFDANKDWILVSTVRSAGQIPLLDEVLTSYGRKLDKFIHFKLSPETAVERLSGRKICPKCQGTFHPKFKPEKVQGICDFCGTKLIERDDDKPEKITKRLEEYNRTLGPILEEYRKRGILVEIDAAPGIEEIHTQVVKALGLK
ncbi:nucleoside monophosphate kinase [Candidatus Dojkabacteria bacterium]|jgi:adenylate kinase|nr:nucleoside monophosphate kinase [Candidatus Dojkabacteria bacterium]